MGGGTLAETITIGAIGVNTVCFLCFLLGGGMRIEWKDKDEGREMDLFQVLLSVKGKDAG